MAERSALNQVVQIGVETTPGTAVAATKKFNAVGIEPSPSLEVDQFRPAGQKYRSLATLNKEWTQASVAGRGTYTELVYLLSSIVDTATITTPTGATSARDWTFTPDSFNDDSVKTFTVEHGSSFRADRFAHAIMTDLSLSFSRDGVSLQGGMIGRAIEDNITLTSGTTTVDLVPIFPTEVSVYMDSTSGALGTTKLNRVVSVDFSLGSRFAPVWVIDSAQSSFAAVIESEPNVQMSMLMEADSEGMAQLTQLRNGDTKFIRISYAFP